MVQNKYFKSTLIKVTAAWLFEVLHLYLTTVWFTKMKNTHISFTCHFKGGIRIESPQDYSTKETLGLPKNTTYEQDPHGVTYFLSPGMRQGNDFGTQYRSAIYTFSQEQMEAALKSKEEYQKVMLGRVWHCFPYWSEVKEISHKHSIASHALCFLHVAVGGPHPNTEVESYLFWIPAVMKKLLCVRDNLMQKENI